MPFGLLTLLLAAGHPNKLRIGLLLLAMAWLNRMLMAVIVGWGVVRDRRSLWLCWLYPVRDLLGFCSWAASFAGRKFSWRGELYVLDAEGRIKPLERSLDFLHEVPQAHD